MHSSDAQSMLNAELKWNNKSNNAFYEAIKAEGLYQLAQKGGLTTGCDMKVLTPYWSQAETILEVGAGYGRVIDYLLKNQFKGSLVAIERCNVFFKYLKKQFGHYKNVHLLYDDILSSNAINGQFDLILMLWSEIADFSPKEQQSVLFKLSTLLNKKGKLIIETLPAATLPLGMEQSDKERTYRQELQGAAIYTHSISLKEVETYAKLAGLPNIKHQTYYTDTRRERLIHILSRDIILA